MSASIVPASTVPDSNVLSDSRLRLPEWLRRPPGSAQSTQNVKKLLRTAQLNTVCEEARCPNISECFGRGTATFMILGDVCTRGCRFCAVTTGKPVFPSREFDAEAVRVRDSAQALGLRHVVVTSVARDDLEDGGASGFVATIRELKSLPEVTVEVLVPDFRGNELSVEKIIEAGPDVFNHNLETVPRLYRKVRPGAGYRRSLDLLRYAHSLNPKMLTKTGIMVGLGERPDEVAELMADSRAMGVEIFTIGQYLQPSREHLKVQEYVSKEQFDSYNVKARELKFRHIAIGPLVRSSYRADEYFGDRPERVGLNVISDVVA